MELIIMGTFIIVSFLLGYHLGKPKNEYKSEPIGISKKKKKVKNDTVIEDDSLRIMLENIDNYNGTSLGQQDVPEDEEVL